MAQAGHLAVLQQARGHGCERDSKTCVVASMSWQLERAHRLQIHAAPHNDTDALANHGSLGNVFNELATIDHQVHNSVRNCTMIDHRD